MICLAVFKHNNSSDQGQMNAKPDKIIAYLRPFSQPQVIFFINVILQIPNLFFDCRTREQIHSLDADRI